MVKTVNIVNFFNSKCAEIFCQDKKQFSIICSFCNLKTLDYFVFLDHFNDVHKNLIEALLEADHELTVPVNVDTIHNQTIKFEEDNQIEFTTSRDDMQKCTIIKEEYELLKDSRDVSFPGCDENCTIIKEEDEELLNDNRDISFPGCDEIEMISSDDIENCTIIKEEYEMLNDGRDISFARYSIDPEVKANSRNNVEVVEKARAMEFAISSDDIENCTIIKEEYEMLNNSRDISFGGCSIDPEVKANSGNNVEVVEKDICESGSSKLTYCKVKTKGRLNAKELNKELQCPICHISKNSKYNLQSHINSHTGARPYNCQLCGKNFTNSGNLRKHMELVHKGIKTHECPTCSKKFQYKFQARRHEMRVHLKVRPYPCDTCENSYLTKKQLAEHRTTHYSTETIVAGDVSTATAVDLELEQKKESKYICEHCGKSFSKYWGIWAHRRLHSDNNQYVCNVCNKQMHNSYNLKDHINTHTGERPHKCEVCGKAFQLKKLLRDHLRIHSDVKAYACKICGKKFSQAAGLYSHKQTH